MDTKYFANYWTARKYAEKHGLVESEYGDADGMTGTSGVSYVCYNKTGSRDDEDEVVVYYNWELQADGHYRPARKATRDFTDGLKHRYGIIVK